LKSSNLSSFSELSKYFVIKNINNIINITRIITAIKVLNANIIQEDISQTKLQTQLQIFLLENNVAYSLGSALFIMYE